jgi:hypothetical protein
MSLYEDGLWNEAEISIKQVMETFKRCLAQCTKTGHDSAHHCTYFFLPANRIQQRRPLKSMEISVLLKFHGGLDQD